VIVADYLCYVLNSSTWPDLSWRLGCGLVWQAILESFCSMFWASKRREQLFKCSWYHEDRALPASVYCFDCFRAILSYCYSFMWSIFYSLKIYDVTDHKAIGHSSRAVSASDCGVRGPGFESHRGRLCLSRQPLWYTALGTGCAPLLQCLGRLSLPPFVSR